MLLLSPQLWKFKKPALLGLGLVARRTDQQFDICPLVTPEAQSCKGLPFAFAVPCVVLGTGWALVTPAASQWPGTTRRSPQLTMPRAPRWFDGGHPPVSSYLGGLTLLRLSMDSRDFDRN